MKSIALITLGFVLWALIHSVLADHQLKQRFRKRFGDRAYRWYRLAYNVFAVLSLLPLLLLYGQLPDRLLWQAPSPWRWLMLAIQGVGLLGLIAAVLHTRVGEFVGITQ